MHIQNGKLYENKTWRYLYPCLKFYSTELINYLSTFFKLGVGISDYNVETEDNCIFILIDTDMRLKNKVESDKYKLNFSKFLDWLKYQPYYVKDYIYSDFDSGEKHMIVLKIPQAHDTTFLSFIRGEYSKMYTKGQIANYFKNISIPTNKEAEKGVNNRLEKVRKILSKDSTYRDEFVEIVNKDFGTSVKSLYFTEAELDYPPKLEEETFNYIEILQEHGE